MLRWPEILRVATLVRVSSGSTLLTYRFSVHIGQTPEKNSPGTQGWRHHFCSDPILSKLWVLVVVVFIHRFVSAHLLLQDSINLEGIAQLDAAGSFVWVVSLCLWFSQCMNLCNVHTKSRRFRTQTPQQLLHLVHGMVLVSAFYFKSPGDRLALIHALIAFWSRPPPPCETTTATAIMFFGRLRRL